MTIKERLSNLKEKINKMKSSKVASIKKATIKFSPFSKKQKKVLTWWLPESPVSDKDGVIADGAIRSGKTISMSLSFAMWAMETFDGQNFGMCGKTIGSFRRNVLFWLKLMLKARKYKVEDKRADNLVVVSKGNVTNYFYIFGGKDERSQDLIQGITLAGIFFDEVVLMPQSFVNQATGRCSVEGSKFWFNCNPEGPYHWFKTGWIDKKEEKNILYLHFTMDDNLSLSEKIKQRYRNMYSGIFFKRYILGLWVIAEGIIYKQFANDTKKYLLTEEPKDILEINVGVDFGGTKSGHSFVATAITRGYKSIIVLSSERHFGDIDPDMLGQLFVDFISKIIKQYGRVDYAYCDSAEQVLIRGLKTSAIKAGLNSITIRDARKNPINDRISATMTLIAQSRFFYTNDCETLVEALSRAIWDPKQLKDKRLDDGTSDIDTLDAFEYSFEKSIKRLMNIA